MSLEKAIRILSEDATVIKFVVQDTPLKPSNDLRRTMLAEIPTMATHVVKYDVNTGLDDQMLAHRLGIVVLTCANPGAFNYSHECSCREFCDKCSATLYLDVRHEGPGVRSVTARDLVSTNRLVAPYFKDHRDTGPVICCLSQGQAVSAQCIATKGVARQHAKWKACFAVWMTYDDDIRYGSTGKIPEVRFKVESEGQLPARQILETALRMMDK